MNTHDFPKHQAHSSATNAISRLQRFFAEEAGNFELNYNEFLLRTYDPQIGRWTGANPFDEFASPYLGMGNDPVSNVDPTGGYIGGGSFVGAIFGTSSKALAAVACPGTATVVGVLTTQIASSIAIGGAFTSHMQTTHIYNHLAASIVPRTFIIGETRFKPGKT